MKVLFLDIDGVLNFNGCRDKIDGYYFVNDSKLKLLREIIDKTGCKIVLSSTWRLGWNDWDNKTADEVTEDYHFCKLRDRLKEEGVEFYSRTPVSDNGYRGDEITEWLKHHPEVDDFVILDDDNDMKPFMSRLVRTSFMKGLQPKHIDKIVKMLNKDSKEE